MKFGIFKNEASYPPLLKEIHNPPLKLFCAGQKLDPADRYFAVVGTRRPSPYGKQMAETFAAALAQAGFVIVSGLAYGIDAIAHEAALARGGKTISVLGSGLNCITPTCNIALAERIQKSGALITEFIDDFPPNKGTFPQRNRIIAGMSLATLVIEAPERSGALITARLALECNRDVFALPSNITQESGAGTNRLIRDGLAFPATKVQDIFECLHAGNVIDACDSARNAAHNFACNADGIKNAKNDGNGKTCDNNATAFFLQGDEKIIYALLKKSQLSFDEIVAETKFPPAKISMALSMLELKGLVSVMGSQAFITR